MTRQPLIDGPDNSCPHCGGTGLAPQPLCERCGKPVEEVPGYDSPVCLPCVVAE